MSLARQGSSALRWVRAKSVEVFSADLRSLAAFRIVLALLVLADLASRATDLTAHYTDRGILPRTVLTQEVLDRWSFSLNLMNGEPFFQALLFGVTALAALALLVGYRTRLMTAIVWVVLLSIQYRNPLVLNAGDILLRMLLFWSIFLPLGAYWSVDRALKGVPPRLSMRFLSVATVALFMQIAFMYWFTAILKSGAEWRIDNSAIYYALSIDQIATPFGSYLLNFPELLELLTFSTLWLEILGPFLLFCPVFTNLVRTGAVAAFMSLHFGIWLTMDIGIFSWVAALCMVCFLPSSFWDSAAKLRAAFPKQPNITRRLQNATVPLAEGHWLPLQARLSITGAGKSSVGDLAVQSDGLASLAVSDAKATQQGGPRFLYLRGLRSKTWSAEKATAERRTRLGGAAGPEPAVLRSLLATNLLVAFFLLYVFCWNLTTVSSFAMSERVASLGTFLGLEQSWAMFAPYPLKEDGWYVIPGTLQGGQQVDLMPITRDDFRSHQEVSWEKPQYLSGTYKNEQWRKYLANIWQTKYADQRLHFGRYICREWNARHTGTNRLETFQITYMLEETLPDYQPSTPEKVILWEHSCS
jgi:hypothetical protein